MLKERILNLLRKHSLSDKLLFEFFSSEEETKLALKELVEEGRIVKVRKEYYIPESLGLIKGTIVSIKENFSFAKISDEEDVMIMLLNSGILHEGSSNGSFWGEAEQSTCFKGSDLKEIQTALDKALAK